jgi:hypothetical protein
MDGRQASTPGIPVGGTRLPHVYSSHDVFFLPREKLGDSALILDDLGGFEALGVAEYLIEQGLKVTYVTRLPALAPFQDMIGRATPIMRRLLQGDFRVLTRTRLDEIRQGECIIVPVEGSKTEMVPADITVLVTPNRAERSVFDGLKAQAPESVSLKLIGDALSPRDLQFAIQEGHLAGRGLASLVAAE